MNRFTEKEFEGREKWLKMNYNDIINGKKVVQFTSNAFDRADFYMTAYTKTKEEKISVGEIKNINRDYEQYPNFQIDYSKIKEIKDIAEKEDRIPYLVAYFTDYSIVWDLARIPDIENRKYKQYCTSTTAVNYNKGKKEKEEIWLTKEEAIYVRKNQQEQS